QWVNYSQSEVLIPNTSIARLRQQTDIVARR
ncbi:MAG: hypothetical protein ACI90G_000465, partial [Urechidicola sp.]